MPFVVVGPPGVFLLRASDGHWTMDDVVGVAQLTGPLRRQLPGYTGRVHAGVCLAFDAVPPRTWSPGAGAPHTGWVVGIDWLLRWLCSLESARGPEPGDLDALRVAAEPVWTRRRVARLPRERNYG